MGYVLGKRKLIGEDAVATVGEVIEELLKLSQHHEVYCCGDNSVYLHVSDENECCCVI